MVDIFVSYASEDRERVRPLVEALEQSGWQVWWDRQIGAGNTFDREIEKAIDQAACIIVVWSAHSVESEWVRTEANEGLEKGNLVPVSVETVRPPLAFRRIQTIDLTEKTGLNELRDSVSRFARPSSQESGDLTPFVGRTQEWARAEAILGRVSDTEGKTILIGGEVGVGKTRMVRELAASARRKGFVVLSGNCLDMDGATPYQPLLEQIAQAARISKPENMRRSLGENAPEVAKLMPELRQQFTDIQEAPVMPPEQERRYILNGVGDFIDRGGRVQPMMLIYEDLHWADDSTCILLRYFADRLKESPILIVGTFRDDELTSDRPFAATLRDLSKERLVDEIYLKCLEKEAVREIIEGRARKTPPPELVDLVFSETEGNPFFVEEVFRHLEEVGKLFDEHGEFRTGVEIADTEVPRGVQLVIGERLGRVSDECRTLLTTAAVVGRTFSFDILVRTATKLDEDDILDAVEEADASGLIEDLSRDREARYGFVHEQIRQSLLMGLSVPRRQRIHLRVADALEATYGARVDEHAGELAYHLYQAGTAADPDKTVDYLIKAGSRALDSLAFEDAIRRFDSALEVLTDTDERQVQARRQKAAALTGMGRIDDALVELDHASMMADSDTREDIILERSKVLLDVWRGTETLSDLEQLLERKQSGDDREGELEAQRWLARAYYVMSLDRSGYAEKVVAAYDRTIELARELGNEKTMAHAMIASAQLVDYDAALYPVARRRLDEAEEIGRRLGDEEVLIDAATQRLGALFGDSEDLLGEKALEKLLARRDPIRLNAHYFRMMWSALAAARLERCVEICDAGIEVAYRIGTLPVQYPTIKAMALLELGRFGDALASLEEEIADEEHRFGASLRELGKFQYMLNCAAVEDALEAAPHLIAESHHLSRVWMLSWIAGSLATTASFLSGEPELVARIESLIGDTGVKPGRGGRAALTLAAGDIEGALEAMKIREHLEVTLRDRRPFIVRKSERAFALSLAGRWQEVVTEVDDCLALCRECKLQNHLWKLLALKGNAMGALGENAQPFLTEADDVRERISKTIDNASHRDAFLEGRIAKAYGL